MDMKLTVQELSSFDGGSCHQIRPQLCLRVMTTGTGKISFSSY